VIGAPHSLQNLAFLLSSVPHDPHNSPAAVISHGQPTVVHINIVSPLASQHAPYRHCDVYGHTSDDAARAAIDGLTGHSAYDKLAPCSPSEPHGEEPPFVWFGRLTICRCRLPCAGQLHGDARPDMNLLGLRLVLLCEGQDLAGSQRPAPEYEVFAMNDTGDVALVDTTRDELREHIAQARERFDRLVRTADPLARPPGSDWTVQQVVAHVLTGAHRCRDLARTGDYHRAAYPSEMGAINQTELEAAMAPIPDLADQLQALEPEIDSYFDAVANEGPVLPFHCGACVDGITVQTTWLGELLLHGHDVAQAVEASWELPERDMLLVARGLMQFGAGYLRAAVSPRTDLCVAFNVRGARPYLIHIHHGTAEFRERRPDDRPDAVLRVPASTLTQLLYQRIGSFTAARGGLLIIGGRRPWLALKLQSYFEPA